MPETTYRAVAAAYRARGAERRLLLWMLPLVVFSAWGVAAAQRHPEEAFVPALWIPGAVWAGCFALHLVFALGRFDGDRLFLPLLTLLFLIGASFHADLGGPATPGLTPQAYLTGVFAALVVLALITAGGRLARRLSLLFEEKVWWRIAGDRPYYESVPFHFVLLGLMLFLGLMLLVGGVRSSGGSLIQVRLPGGVSFTPSEFIRLAVAFFLADYLGRNSRVMRGLRHPLGRVWPLNRIFFERRTELTVVLTTIAIYLLFFYAFRDFGPAAVIILLTLCALYAATGRILTPLLLGLGIALAVAVPTWQNLAFHTLGNRVEMWLNPWHTSFVNGDHQARILWSIASGGWFGMGPGVQNLPHTLPLARNDAAFAGIAASMGMWVGLIVLALYAAITWRGMLIARAATTDRARLLAFTLTALLALQAVWICGAMVRVFPFTGINVPFLSTGLSSMLASALALGTLWNLSRRADTPPDPTEPTPEVARGIGRMARPLTALFALPALGLLLYGCPLLLGDRVLLQTAVGRERSGERAVYDNPYIERFRQRFARGRIFSADDRLLAFSNPSRDEMEALREHSPSFARRVERGERGDRAGERWYPLASAAAQLVGWAPQGRFSAQAGSVETTWDGLLRGYHPRDLPSYYRLRHNPLVRPPQPQDLQLTVRADVQEYAARRLAEAVREWDGAGGAAVVYDAATGAVLAAATAPSFDPNGLTLERMERYIAQHPRTALLTNKALARSALYYPGSSFKILTAAAGLDEGVEGAVTCRNGRNAEAMTWELDGVRWRREPGRVADYGRGGHGAMSLAGDLDAAFARSCNVYFGWMAVKLGPERMRRAMEAAELSATPSTRDLAEYLPHAGFGQIVVKASPLEMAGLAAAAGVALPELPGAAAARPHWVQAVVTRASRREPDGLPGAPNRAPYRPFPAETAQRLRQAMLAAVEDPSGTAHAAFYRYGQKRLEGVTVGGKTGTAEFDHPRGRGRRSTRGRHAWFVGFARSDHEALPRTLAFAVLVEDVRAGATGGAVCAPVARDLVARILPRPGESPPAAAPGGLERFYRDTVRPRLGPLGPLVDWLREQFR